MQNCQCQNIKKYYILTLGPKFQGLAPWDPHR